MPYMRSTSEPECILLFSRFSFLIPRDATSPSATLFLLPILLCAAFAQNATDRVIAEAQKPSALETNLQQLTDQIGGRVPGTPAMQKAVAWGIAAFKAAGADSVHTEDFSIQASWAEGATRMTVVAPEQFVLRDGLHRMGSRAGAAHSRTR